MFTTRFLRFTPRRTYLDMAAATPVRSEVRRAMQPYLAEHFANPSAIHAEGQQAKRAVEHAREQIARTLKVKTDEVLFTASGTESNNLAILGHVRSLAQSGRSYSDMEIITTALEHPSVTAVVAECKALGVTVREVAVDAGGCVQLESLQQQLNDKTVLVSVAYVNSEVGVIQPLSKISRVLRAFRTEAGTQVVLHVDAAQAPLWLPCQINQLGADLVSFDAAKCFGPKGVGMLIARRTVSLTPVLFGGGQERGLRPGTENVPGVVGAGEALSLAQSDHALRAQKVQAVRDRALAILPELLPEAVLNGPTGTQRVANNINFSLPGIDTEYAAVVLDAQGFAVSTKSACSGAGGGASAVVESISDDAARARSTLRLTFGREVRDEDLRRAFTCLRTHIDKMQAASLI